LAAGGVGVLAQGFEVRSFSCFGSAEQGRPFAPAIYSPVCLLSLLDRLIYRDAQLTGMIDNVRFMRYQGKLGA
jgi:hypothetical protein